MLELYYDLHIHSCLSPCGNDDSTPANIAMLAQMLGLDVVALTDHCTCKNCPAFFEAAQNVGLLPIAGMELTTEEEIHVLCLFSELESAMRFDEIVHNALLPFKNKPEIYGNQLIKNIDNETIGEEEVSLLNATGIDLYSVYGLIQPLGGIMIPAHIDRSAFSLISSLGTVMPDAGFDCIEIKYPDAVDNLAKKYPYISQCKVIHNSDAHQLEDISLPIRTLSVKEKSAYAVLQALSAKHI